MRPWVCCIVVFATSATALVSVSQSPAALPITIDGKLDSATEHMLIPVTIGGHRFWCNPDTGFSALVALDPDKAAAAGLQVAAGVSTPDSNPRPPRDSSISVDLVVGGVTFPNQSISLRKFAEEADMDMDCIFGVALLRRFVVEFDYTTPGLALYERSAFQPAVRAETIPLIFYTNPRVPFVDIQVSFTAGPRESLRVVPDTGTSFYSAIMVGGAADRVKARVQKSAMAITYPDPEPGRILQVVAARPSAITVGPFSIKEPVVAFVSGNVGGGGIADGTLGEGFFRRFTVAFDFEGRTMYLKANTRFAEASPFDAGGIGLIRRNGRDVVFTVLADSPGAHAGVRVGDVLLAIDERHATTLTPVDVRNLFSLTGRNGRTRRIVLERSGRRVAVRINLTPRL
jgi:hypothetical protein